MKFKGTNKIITEDDIILSDGSNTLSERLSSQQLEIDQLKSNIKWIYKSGSWNDDYKTKNNAMIGRKISQVFKKYEDLFKE